ncbi:alpha/beta fold hydrolase [[Limnothrix rosea] IAM M-220]|uniref:alpha/beta fold hydrolase n=1 Tax=[Limnothrix rosea] IAM M-220 TaxID=454133 RepID=UPI00095BBF3F|nr:alpha/beta hydrolase [[Limnothrix rosea] IAM M-220]OKH18475.1 alpha/beta hydrolase [[Limnothrix rosea] IAM M-220]
MVCVVRNSRLKLSQGQIFWRETGQGEAVIFIHGACRESSQWSEHFEVLGQKFHCFAPDLLGFGDSERPPAPYSIQWESEVLAELFENIRLKQFYLVGDGLGAWVAARYALNHPEQIKGLILRSPLGVETDKNPSYFWEKCLVSPLPLVPWFLKLISPIAPLLGLKKKIKNAFEHRKTLRRSPGTCKLLFRSGARLKSEYLNYQLAQLTAPTLILSTPDDSPSQLAQSQAYARLIKHSNYQELEDKEEAIAAIQTWLKTQEKTPSK